MSEASIGYSLTSWDPAPNAQPGCWIEAIHQIFAAGVRHVTIVPYWFFDPETLGVAEVSKHNLERGPTLDAITIAMRTGRELGMSVSLNPLLEIDAAAELADIWRGSIRIRAKKLPQFFQSYSKFIMKMGETAAECDANRLYLGSELANLSTDPKALNYWRKLAADLREFFPGGDRRLSYAANYDEYDRVLFWDQLDEIAIDAYFGLESVTERTQPDVHDLVERWQNRFRELRLFSQQQNRNVVVAEFGVIPFRSALQAPWDWHPTQEEREDYDPLVQARAVEALLLASKSEQDWLKEVDFWHWQLPCSSGSLYGIRPGSPTAKVIEKYARAN